MKVDAVELLTTQHRALERLLDATAAADESARATALAMLADELGKHLAAEEQVFYPAVRTRPTEDILLESLEEHLSLKRLLSDLLALAPDADTWTAKLKVLDEQARHHHREEEEHLFPAVERTWPDAERCALGEEMSARQDDLERLGAERTAVEQTDAAAPLR
jgi:hemerythrin superfamily protein